MLKVETVGPVRIFHLADKIMGGPETQEIRDRLKALVEEKSMFLVMDFANVRWINSAGIGVIISCLTTLRKNNGDIRFANLHGTSQKYFNITQLERIIRAFDTVGRAVESFSDIEKSD